MDAEPERESLPAASAPGALDTSDVLSRIYERRFDERDLQRKDEVWRTLCQSFFQHYIRPDSTVLDLGAGNCEFINHIDARRKIAVDLNPDTKLHAADAEVVQVPSTDLGPIVDRSVDVVFTSNFFEHLPTKDDLLQTLRECRRVLVPGGRLIVLMPNIRYLPGRYWDYLDHHIPLTHVSLTEATQLSGFTTERVIPRFLPFTVKDSPLPAAGILVRTYLRFPVAWRVFGRQMLVIAHR
jgi:SAM-dependent methyltransferase